MGCAGIVPDWLLMPNSKTTELYDLIRVMAGDLCAVLQQAFYLTLDSTTVFGVFLIMRYFIYFTRNPIASSLCDTKQLHLKPFITIRRRWADTFLTKQGMISARVCHYHC